MNELKDLLEHLTPEQLAALVTIAKKYVAYNNAPDPSPEEAALDSERRDFYRQLNAVD